MFFEVPDWDVGEPVAELKPSKKSKKGPTVPPPRQVTVEKQSNDTLSSKTSEKSRQSTDTPSPTVTVSASSEKLTAANLKVPLKIATPVASSNKAKKALNKLSGARFRYLNQKLYESNSKQALSYFQENPDDFAHYHSGFREQTKAWPVNPVDIFIKRLQSWNVRRKGTRVDVVDMGCGEAKLAASFSSEASMVIHSFDLAAVNDFVTVASMTDVPLEPSSVDLVIFSLSLMNTDYLDALREAHRILKENGELWIAEVSSRMVGERGLSSFLESLKGEGFKLDQVDQANPVFVVLYGRKTTRPKTNGPKSGTPKSKTPAVLKSCLYKKR